MATGITVSSAAAARSSRESPSATKTATATRASWVPPWATIAIPPSALSDAWRTRPPSCAPPSQQAEDAGVRFQLLRYCCVARARFMPRVTPYAATQDEADLGPGSSPVQQYAAHADQQHAVSTSGTMTKTDHGQPCTESKLRCLRPSPAAASH
jgi:hypothetical protein